MKDFSINKMCTYISIAIFSLLITLPLIFINTDKNKISVTENRKLSPFPPLKTEKNKYNHSFIKDFEKFVDDNIGFKQEAVIADIAYFYKVFHKVKVPHYLEGKNQHLFYAVPWNNIPIYQGKNHLKETELKQSADAFMTMKKYFEKTGAKFLMMTIPEKENIYPEYYPKSIIRLNDKTTVDILIEYLQKNTDIDVFSVKEQLINNKGKELLYYRNVDPAHWNMNGAFIGYMELMKKIQKSFPDIKILNKEDFDITEMPSKGTLAHLADFKIIADAMRLKDSIYGYNLKGGYNFKVTDKVPEGVVLDKNNNFYHYTNTKDPNLPKLLMIGDSFIYLYMLPMLTESFSDVYFTRYSNAYEIVKLQETIKADIVVYETVERGFNYAVKTKSIAEMSNYIDNDFTYESLKTIDQQPAVYIDIPVIKDGALPVNSDTITTPILGWAVDAKEEKLSGGLYLKLNNKYYKAVMMERPDLAKVKQEYIYAGFEFNIPTNELISTDKIQIIVISNDKTYKYKPFEIKFKIENK
ncbi:hypothetical protein [Petroclostridium sp. X23]|uniref:alginate O-acetyltransferase AlgX-related protein n=1 Tax=Petroclostridium sp. X23 TaxID=3045146 RepID=UPI0024AD3260|nr:hypothetical protein [Petroclostridium sp. X23]WHH57422.1 hypothetical protein QKW49_16490 [Petroclostridium sp. X23]